MAIDRAPLVATLASLFTALLGAGCGPAVGPTVSRAATLAATAPVCRPGGRLLVEVKPVALYVHPAVEVDLAARLPPAATGFGLAGLKQRDPEDSPADGRVEDPSPRLSLEAERALEGEGLDVRLLAAIGEAVRTGSRCDVLVFASPPSGLVPTAADDLYVVEADVLFGGRPAELVSRLAWAHLKDATSLADFEGSLSRCRHFGEVARHGIVMNVSQVKKGMGACEAVEASFDAFDAARVDVPGRPMEEWLVGDAAGLKTEVRKVLEREAAAMAARLHGAPAPH